MKKADSMKWKATPEDAKLIGEIALRAWSLLTNKRKSQDLERIAEDLTACHLNGCPLRLTSMLWSSDHDLMHDVTLIFKRIDRRTGKLTGDELPIYHMPLKEGNGELAT